MIRDDPFAGLGQTLGSVGFFTSCFTLRLLCGLGECFPRCFALWFSCRLAGRFRLGQSLRPGRLFLLLFGRALHKIARQLHHLFQGFFYTAGGLACRFFERRRSALGGFLVTLRYWRLVH
jgi:hypothetical protein